MPFKKLVIIMLLIVQRVSRGHWYLVLILTLHGCGPPYPSIPSSVRDTYTKTEDLISPGDNRNEVQSLLGKPLIDARELGVEVYRIDGRDIAFALPLPLFVPGPGEHVTLVAIVLYDDNERVIEIKTDMWASGYKRFGEPFTLLAKDYLFVYVIGKLPDTLLGPNISVEELARSQFPEDSCTIVALLGEYPISSVSVNDVVIADFRGASYNCDHVSNRCDIRNPSLYGTFIRRPIIPGSYRISLTTLGSEKIYRNIECKQGEVVFVSLKIEDIVQHVRPLEEGFPSSLAVKGSIEISDSPLDSSIDRSNLRQILWHDGMYYGPMSNHDISIP